MEGKPARQARRHAPARSRLHPPRLLPAHGQHAERLVRPYDAHPAGRRNLVRRLLPARRHAHSGRGPRHLPAARLKRAGAVARLGLPLPRLRPGPGLAWRAHRQRPHGLADRLRPSGAGTGSLLLSHGRAHAHALRREFAPLRLAVPAPLPAGTGAGAPAPRAQHALGFPLRRILAPGPCPLHSDHAGRLPLRACRLLQAPARLHHSAGCRVRRHRGHEVGLSSPVPGSPSALGHGTRRPRRHGPSPALPA